MPPDPVSLIFPLQCWHRSVSRTVRTGVDEAIAPSPV